MVRVPVPEDEYSVHDRISVAGAKDHLYGEADVNLEDRDHGPMGLRVDRDADGLYVGVYEGYADEVADYLGTEPEWPAPERDAEEIAAMVEDGVCPWCPEGDRYEGDGVAQHAASAHPDEWDAYNAEA